MIPTQDETDFNDPEQHFLWALHNIPTMAGTGAISHPAILKGWSKHLVAAGFRHVDWLRELADEDGNIHVSQLPNQVTKKIPAFRGPRHAYNNAATWVDMDIPLPPPNRIPDINQFTIQENLAILQQLEDKGMLPGRVPVDMVAQELNDG